MTSELAKLLDGPVADRFGRPKDRCGVEFYLSGDEFSACESFGLDDPIASALWLAHLVDQCGDRGWRAVFAPPDDLAPTRGRIAALVSRPLDGGVRHERCDSTSRLEAVARAMLAVPVEAKP